MELVSSAIAEPADEEARRANWSAPTARTTLAAKDRISRRRQRIYSVSQCVPHPIEKRNEQKVAVKFAFKFDKAAKKLFKSIGTPYLGIVTTVKEIEAAIPRLSRA